jgi:hypothetical protein
LLFLLPVAFLPDAVKSEIFKYEGLYHQDAHRNIVEKLKKVKVVSFQTIEEIFKIEFQKNAQIQIDEF